MTIIEIIQKYTAGDIGLEETNEKLKEAGADFYLNPQKNDIGHNEDGVGLMDTGTVTLDKVKVIEDENGIHLEEAVFDPKAWEGNPLPVVNVQYKEVWYKVAEDGVTLK